MEDADDDATQRSLVWRYRGLLVCWYGAALLFAAFMGFAAGGSVLQPALYVFVPLELATFVTAMGVDDWTNDFRGDHEVLVRGTTANLVVAAISVCVSVF